MYHAAAPGGYALKQADRDSGSIGDGQIVSFHIMPRLGNLRAPREIVVDGARFVKELLYLHDGIEENRTGPPFRKK